MQCIYSSVSEPSLQKAGILFVLSRDFWEFGRQKFDNWEFGDFRV
jgi:hypothetical protein